MKTIILRKKEMNFSYGFNGEVKDLKGLDRGIVRKMRISHVKSIFPADTKGLQTFYKLFLYSFNNL